MYIGNDPLWSKNPKCPGGPHLKSTYDDYFDKWASNSHGKSTSPAYGFEVWCNMSGRYTFFVAAGVPIKQLSICNIAVFGTRYIREAPLTTTVEVKTDSYSVIDVPHVYAEDVIADQLAINIRQKAKSELNFVTFTNGASSTEVFINPAGVLPG